MLYDIAIHPCLADDNDKYDGGEGMTRVVMIVIVICDYHVDRDNDADSDGDVINTDYGDDFDDCM